jgi:hypothetical protein
VGIVYYQEKESGDYLAVDTSTNAYYRQQGRDHFEGRSTAIQGDVNSVCTTGISREYLKTKCKRVLLRKVPQEWLEAIGYQDAADPKVHDHPF